MSVVTIVVLMLALVQVPATAPAAQNGVVTGQVRLPGGALASGVRVAAMAVPEANSPSGAGVLVSLTQSDSSGSYRLENIPPGRYYIQAGLLDLPNYYPGVISPAAATVVSVPPGGLVEKLDFTMLRSVGAAVRGRVPMNTSPRPARVTMFGARTGFFSNNTATIGADGAFEFHKVMPGSYTLNVTPYVGLPNLSIVVADTDVNLGLPSGPGFKVSGIVGFGSRSRRPADQKVVLTGPSPWAQLETVIDDGGNFQLPNVPPGAYTVRTVPGTFTPAATIVVADRDISGVVMPAFVEVSGNAVLADGTPLPRLSPALMIEVKRARGSTLTTPVHPDGTFKLPLAEGEYRLAVRMGSSGLALKSLAYGSTDLLSEPLRLDGMSEVSEIWLTLEKK
jgi:hypothetical protein